MFTPIGHILPEAVKKNGMASKVAKARIFAVFEQTARGIVPEETFHDFKVLHLVEGTLTIACRSSSTASRLRAETQTLLASVREAGVERLRFLLSPWR